MFSSGYKYVLQIFKTRQGKSFYFSASYRIRLNFIAYFLSDTFLALKRPSQKPMIRSVKILIRGYRMGSQIFTKGLLRLPQVLALIPVSKSAWWAGIKTGRFPKPVKIGPRTSAWEVEVIDALLESFSRKDTEK
jgi:predicted DNA-binding transcriptional regulator AlpA